jgi:hypothetical protein
LTVVMIEPTIVVMRFDLGALVGLPAPHDAPTIGTPWLNQGVEFGTRIAATGTLLWFSPDAKQEPTAVALSGADRGEIVAQGKRSCSARSGDAWQVTVAMTYARLDLRRARRGSRAIRPRRPNKGGRSWRCASIDSERS